MEDSSTYTNKIEAALTAKIEQLDFENLKQLKDDYRLFQSAFQALYNVLLKKGLVNEDPYKYEMKISEVNTPSESPFTESEKTEQISIRLSQFESYLDFLNNYYQFSFEFLTMGRIKRLISLTKYFTFTQFSENTQHINTRYFAQIVQMVKKGSDPISTGIINEGLLQLDKTSRKIFHTLKELTFIHKERYKLELRKLLINEMHFDRDYTITHQEEVIKKIKFKFAELTGDKAFYPDLVVEILKEDFSSEAENLRDEVLRRLEIVKENKTDKNIVYNYKNTLIDGARVVIAVGFQLENGIKKLLENQNILESMDKSFFTKVKRVLMDMFGKKAEHIIHEVDYLDPVSSTRKIESIDFSSFCSEAGRKAQSLISMMSKTSPAFKRIETSSEDQLYNFLAKSIEELQNYHKKMSALDEFFLANITDSEYKGRVRSIKAEISAVKNAIIKANQKRYEYIAQKEEQEQMKRLGIRENS